MVDQIVGDRAKFFYTLEVLILNLDCYAQAPTIRMKEAALLLKEGKLSVSDVGYQLGFTNLSHFSKRL